MEKPKSADGYDDDITNACERLLVTLLRGLGPWADSVVLVGGLTPRYLVKGKPPAVPEHAGTQDVDVVIDLALLTIVDAYQTFEDNLLRLGFARSTNRQGKAVNWRWEVPVGKALLCLEFLADLPGGKRVEPLPTEGNISAVHIPHSSIVFEHYEVSKITARTLGDNGVVTLEVKHADLVAFTVLKAFAFAQRWEKKDAHDLVYCLENAKELDKAVTDFRAALTGAHAVPINEALQLLRHHFADDASTEGYLKDGPVAVAKFELAELDEFADDRARRQREAASIVGRLLQGIGA